jgi:hypothetical protein
MKKIYAAIIVAAAIVFHAAAPKIFGPPSGVGGWKVWWKAELPSAPTTHLGC